MKNGGKLLWDWRWPDVGRDESGLMNEIKKIKSPYEENVRPVCYPGATLSEDLLSKVAFLLSKQINAIGCHTHGEILDGNWEFSKGEGGFEIIQRMEAQAIWMIASVLGGSPRTTDGYFCGGGTEANIQGMWIGREWLKNHPDPMNKGIVILTSPLFHYSIAKASEMLDIGYSQYILCHKCKEPHIFYPDPSGTGLNLVKTNEKGQMSIPSLESVFQEKYQEGFRRFMIVPTVGTSLMGSIDPIKEIGEFIRHQKSETDASFYLHVDASFAGFTVPFVNSSLEFGFSIPEVMSMTVDGDKMGRLPYPAGVFLCRKELMSLVARKVNYVRGNEDNTLSGSRSCISQVLAWYLYQVEGIDGQRKYVNHCIKGRDKLVSLIKSRLPWVRILPHSPWVNFAPMEINIENGKIPEKISEGNGVLAPYHMRSDFYQESKKDNTCPITIYKVCIMPHNLSQIEQFVDDLEKAKRE